MQVNIALPCRVAIPANYAQSVLQTLVFWEAPFNVRHEDGELVAYTIVLTARALVTDYGNAISVTL